MINETYLFFIELQHAIGLCKERKEQSLRRGEDYNVFNVIGIETNEVKLHSAIISNLLDPHGAHGLGSKPLDFFLDECGLASDRNDLNEAVVRIEECHGSKSEDLEKGGRIDIVVNINGFYLIIENKINAGDQVNQLYRYHNEYKTSNHRLMYLTLDGKSPSKESSQNLRQGEDFFCISYKEHISRWIRTCMSLSFDKPLIRETLRQYLKTIYKITRQNMDKEIPNELFEIMDKYPEVVNTLSNPGTYWHYRLYLVKTYIIKPLQAWCETTGFKLHIDDYFLTQSGNFGFGIYKSGWNKIICINFNGNDFTDGDYGIRMRQENDNWPYAKNKLSDYPTWNIAIAKNIISGKVFEYVKTLFEDLYKQISENPQKYLMD